MNYLYEDVAAKYEFESDEFVGTDLRSSPISLTDAMDGSPINQITGPAFWPYRCIGFIRSTYNTGRKPNRGTGVLISDSHVLTCAHNVYGAADVFFRAAQVSRLGFPFGVAEAKKWLISPNYEDDPTKASHDWAVIALTSTYNGQIGKWNISSEPDSILVDGSFFVTGYSAYKNRALYGMYHSSGKLHNIQENSFRHMISANDGGSGSPIWYMRNGVTTVVGIHNKGDTKYNRGCRLTAEKIDRIVTWMFKNPPNS